MRHHVYDWFNWAQSNMLDVERMEDILLVSGCTLVTSWAAAVFLDGNREAKITLASRTLSNGGTSFVWSNIQGLVVYHNSSFDPVRSPGYVCSAWANFFFCFYGKQNPPMTPDQCVFIKGFQVKRTFIQKRIQQPGSHDDPNVGYLLA